MGFRFRKVIKVLPGIRLNLSRGGVSTSIGKPGATINGGGKRGPRATVGIPGTGLSYSESLSPGTDEAQGGAGAGRLLAWGVAALVVALVLIGLFT